MLTTTQHPSKPTLIGFGGPKEHGKDTLAEMMAVHIGGTVMGMSDAITEAVIELNALVPVGSELHIQMQDGGTISGLVTTSRLIALVGVTEAKRVPEVRRLYQVLGTDIVRRHQPGAWVAAARKRIAQLQAEGAPVLITGIRFPIELAMVRELGGAALWVERPGHPTSGGADHISEHALTAADFDHTVMNDGSLDALRSKSARLADSFSTKNSPYPLVPLAPGARAARAGS